MRLDWAEWASGNELREHYLGLGYEEENCLREFSGDNFFTWYMGFSYYEEWLGNYLLKIYLEAVSTWSHTEH